MAQQEESTLFIYARSQEVSQQPPPPSPVAAPVPVVAAPVSPSWALGLLLAQPPLGDSGAETPKTLLWAVGPVTEVTPEPR